MFFKTRHDDAGHKEEIEQLVTSRSQVVAEQAIRLLGMRMIKLEVQLDVEFLDGARKTYREIIERPMFKIEPSKVEVFVPQDVEEIKSELKKDINRALYQTRTVRIGNLTLDLSGVRSTKLNFTVIHG